MKNNSFLESLANAFAGLVYCIKNERNVKIHITAAVLALFASALLKLSVVEILFVLFAIFFVFIAEIFNTAVENCCNMISTENNEFAKIAKDCAAAAVLLAAVNAVITGLIVFLPKLAAFI